MKKRRPERIWRRKGRVTEYKERKKIRTLRSTQAIRDDRRRYRTCVPCCNSEKTCFSSFTFFRRCCVVRDAGAALILIRVCSCTVLWAPSPYSQHLSFSLSLSLSPLLFLDSIVNCFSRSCLLSTIPTFTTVILNSPSDKGLRTLYTYITFTRKRI